MAKVTHDFPAMRGEKKDRVTIFDTLSDFVDSAQALPTAERSHYNNGSSWNGGLGYDETARLCRSGDLARVAPSDKLMSELESKFHFQSSAFRTVDAIAGGAPNVAAFLAGSPLAMRQRRRVASEQAPLNIVIDIASSSGVDAHDLTKRGTALLALVRLLSAMRPVNLYIAVATCPYSQSEFSSSAIAFRLDTAPLDLARAAHVLCHTGVARQLFYAGVKYQIGASDYGLGWAYSDVDYYRSRGVQFWQRALGVDELLFIAPAFITDENITAPVKWLERMIAEYGGQSEE